MKKSGFIINFTYSIEFCAMKFYMMYQYVKHRFLWIILRYEIPY